MYFTPIVVNCVRRADVIFVLCTPSFKVSPTERNVN